MLLTHINDNVPQVFPLQLAPKNTETVCCIKANSANYSTKINFDYHFAKLCYCYVCIKRSH